MEYNSAKEKNKIKICRKMDRPKCVILKAVIHFWKEDTTFLLICRIYPITYVYRDNIYGATV